MNESSFVKQRFGRRKLGHISNIEANEEFELDEMRDVV